MKFDLDWGVFFHEIPGGGDRYADLLVSGVAWMVSGDPVRALAVLVVATRTSAINASSMSRQVQRKSLLNIVKREM